jgi:integrase
MKGFEGDLEKANKGLDKVKIQLLRRRLYLRASLPDKTNPSKNSQTRIATGLPANKEGLQRAKGLASELQSEMYTGQFSWEKWGSRRPKGNSIGDLIETLSKDWERGKTESQKKNFRNDYWFPWQRLPGEAEISGALLEQTIVKQTEEKSRSRQRYIRAYKKLAEAAGLTVDWGHLEGERYRPEKPRNIPSKELILANFDKIQGGRKGTAPGWRWIYGMLATFGLRPSEAFRVTDISGLSDRDAPRIKVVTAKRKRREIRTVLALPIDAEWVETFDLKEKRLPSSVPIEGRSNQQIGRTVSNAFRRYEIDFLPYDLRHAYAIRLARSRVPLQMAAKLMGHSPKVHYETYLEYIDEEDFKILWNHLEGPQ